MVPVEWFTGPLGGALAVAFAAGSAAGYGFAARTVLSIARQQRAEDKITWDRERAEWVGERVELLKRMEKMEADHKAEVGEMKSELKELRDILMGRQPLPRFVGMRRPEDEPEWQASNLDKLKDVK